MYAAGKRTILVAALALVAALIPLQPTHLVAAPDTLAKLDSLLKVRSAKSNGHSRVIIHLKADASLSVIDGLVKRAAGGAIGRRLAAIGGRVAYVSNGLLKQLAANPLVERITLDREVIGATERTGATVGASAVRQQLGYDGTGVGVAIIDSGVAAWHDDLSDAGTGQRVTRFVDFVEGITTPHDDYGHGTHVAGIIAGNGFDSDGARTGIAPGANLVVLKVLDDTGRGHISDVIAAIDYAIAERGALNIRVINLSVASGVYESYLTDPLTLAAERAVKAGIVVVAAAGNNGRTSSNLTQYGGITSPGNSPWVLTVGASSHMGTAARGDDTVARFSSRGPSAIDYRAKPDLVAPGVGIESLSNPDSTLFASHPASRLGGTRPAPEYPYMSLSGTSMAAPVVTGAVALMLQANPGLTPNAVKAILQYTAEVYPNHDPLTEGAGFLNARGATELAKYFAAPNTSEYPDSTGWGRQVTWGNRQFWGGRLTPDANAWSLNARWGTWWAGGQTIWWGLRCGNSDCSQTQGKWRVDSSNVRNVVWGSVCSGADCSTEWRIEIVNSTDDGETVVWGTDNGETVVWGTDGGETVVWGTGDGETVVWGTGDGETVVWGTSCSDASCQPVIWSER
jgi:serine protease AprX